MFVFINSIGLYSAAGTCLGAAAYNNIDIFKALDNLVYISNISKEKPIPEILI